MTKRDTTLLKTLLVIVNYEKDTYTWMKKHNIGKDKNDKFYWIKEN